MTIFEAAERTSAGVGEERGSPSPESASVSSAGAAAQQEHAASSVSSSAAALPRTSAAATASADTVSAEAVAAANGPSLKRQRLELSPGKDVEDPKKVLAGEAKVLAGEVPGPAGKEQTPHAVVPAAERGPDPPSAEQPSASGKHHGDEHDEHAPETPQLGKEPQEVESLKRQRLLALGNKDDPTRPAGPYEAGDLVEVFFNTNDWQLRGYRRVLLPTPPGTPPPGAPAPCRQHPTCSTTANGTLASPASPADGNDSSADASSATSRTTRVLPHTWQDYGPVWGKSQGWVRATVTEQHQSGEVSVLLEGEFQEPMSGRKDRDLLWRAEPQHVRRRKDADPVVSLLVVRWWDYHSHTQKNEYKITSEFAVRTFVENSGLVDLLGTRFEIFSVFVKHSADLDAFDPETIYKSMTGFHKVGLYYLWPAQKRNAHEVAGMVEERLFFNMLERAEDAGIDTRYPAPLHLYRQLCGKQYYNAACLNKNLQTPVTTRVLATNIKKDALQAAKSAVQALNEIRRQVGPSCCGQKRGAGAPRNPAAGRGVCWGPGAGGQKRGAGAQRNPAAGRGRVVCWGRGGKCCGGRIVGEGREVLWREDRGGEVLWTWREDRGRGGKCAVEGGSWSFSQEF